MVWCRSSCANNLSQFAAFSTKCGVEVLYVVLFAKKPLVRPTEARKLPRVMDHREIAVGQRWASNAEPELGLGVVVKIDFGRVDVHFPAAAEQRLYALASAPLRRVRYTTGDTIEVHDGRKLRVEAVEEVDRRLRYQTSGGIIEEAALADSIRFSRPDERLLAGVVDELEAFRRRVAARRWREQLLASPARGFKGARIDLLLHQLATAGEVADRPLPRVLLADEVGLGKTIEACLIAHRLLLTGRASRVLVVVPEPLIHQWFVELMRRFNLMFSLFDAERWDSLKRTDKNPFEDSQWVLMSKEFLVSDPEITDQAVAAGWDLLIIDEAHHLAWAPEQPSAAYQAAQRLADKVPGVLLLTATPEQLGQTGHFARLRLLDPDRYSDLEAFREEAAGYRTVADLVDVLEETNKPLTRTAFAKKAGRLEAATRLLEDWPKGVSRPVPDVVERLIDAGGPGRVWFRTTREQLTGFPARRAVLHPLSGEEDSDSSRIRWLADLLGGLGQEKVLLIAHRRETVEQIAEALGRYINLPIAVFHEGLTLIQRDRHAAYFAEPDGARLLLCSEIGSEGRNFQFAHHLVLFDLPPEPELLEQRIGRLDRIGQRHEIFIHVPFLKESSEALWVRWYHEGLNAFEQCLPTGHGFGSTFGPQLDKIAQSGMAAAADSLLTETRTATEAFRTQLTDGRDRLLALRPEARKRAEQLIEQIRTEEGSTEFREFALDLFESCGMTVDAFSADRVRLSPGPLLAEHFPGLPADGLLATFSRSEALGREDLTFLSSDHPLLEAALDSALGSEAGNASFALWNGSGFDGIVLEAWFTIEAIAPKRLHIERFLPPRPHRVLIDHEGKESAKQWPEKALQEGEIGPLIERGAVRRKLLPVMFERAKEAGEGALPEAIASAETAMRHTLDGELERLKLLQRLNGLVRPEEINRLESEREELAAAIRGARSTLDAVRLVWCRA